MSLLRSSNEILPIWTFQWLSCPCFGSHFVSWCDEVVLFGRRRCFNALQWFPGQATIYPNLMHSREAISSANECMRPDLCSKIVYFISGLI